MNNQVAWHGIGMRVKVRKSFVSIICRPTKTILFSYSCSRSLSVESLTPRTSTYSTLRYELWKLESSRWFRPKKDPIYGMSSEKGRLLFREFDIFESGRHISDRDVQLSTTDIFCRKNGKCCTIKYYVRKTQNP